MVDAMEIATAVRMHKPKDWTVQRFEKVGLRNTLACSLVSLAALLQVDVDYRRTVAGNLLLRLAGKSRVTGDRPSWIY